MTDSPFFKTVYTPPPTIPHSSNNSICGEECDNSECMSEFDDISVDSQNQHELMITLQDSPHSNNIRGVSYTYKLPNSNINNCGTGQIIAVLDTGVDPGADGLTITLSGKPKILDIVDCTRGGDIDTSSLHTAIDICNNVEVRSHSGKLIKLDPSLFKPGDILNTGSMLLSNLIGKAIIGAVKGLDKKIKYTIVDVITKKCGDTFKSQICIDDMFEGIVEDYAINKKYYSIIYNDRKINFGVKYYNNGNITSLVFESGSHGTHVAGIISANFPTNPEKNGIAPDSQIVSLKIGDSRIEGLETTRSLIRAMNEIVDRDIHLINLSFGEPVNECMTGELINMIDTYCRKHNIIFVSSAGNDGPGRMTVNAPSASTSSIISVGAYINREMLEEMHFINDNGFDKGVYHWSSRGPTSDGDDGITVVAPGAAMTSISCWQESSISFSNGTSMASPYVCGYLAQIFSILGYTPYFYWVKRFLMNTAVPIEFDDCSGTGHGVINPEKLLHELRVSNTSGVDYGYNMTCEYDGKKHRGIFMRAINENDTIITADIHINVFYKNKSDRYFEKVMDIYLTDDIDDIIECPCTVLVTNNTPKICVKIKLHSICSDYSGHICLKERGGKFVVASLPVNIIIPDNTVSANKPINEKVVLAPGVPSRTTIIPKGSILNIDVKNFTINTKFYISIQQMLPGISYKSQGVKKHISSTTKDKTIKYKVYADNLTEVCFVQNITDQTECTVTYTISVYNYPCLPSSVIYDTSVTSIYIEPSNTMRIAMKTCLTEATSLLYPYSHTISESADNMIRTDRFNDIKQPVYQLINNYNVPRGTGTYSFNISDNNDIYESTLIEGGFITLYRHNTPIAFARHYDGCVDIKHITRGTVMFMSTSQSVLKNLTNTPLIFTKDIIIPIKTYKSKSDCINDIHNIQQVTKCDTYFFRPIINNSLSGMAFNSYILKGVMLGQDIYVVKGSHTQNKCVESAKKTSEYADKLNIHIKQLNPKTIKYINHDDYSHDLFMWESSPEFSTDSEIYCIYLMLNALITPDYYKKKLQQRNIDKTYPYFLIYHADYNMKNQYLKLVKDHFDNFNKDSGYTERDMYELLVTNKEKHKREYIKYMFDIKQTVF